MATTFNVISLGNFASIDPTEGNTLSENADSLVGQTFGGVGDPLVNYFQSFSPGSTGFGGGNTVQYDMNNSASNDAFSINGGPDQVFDGTALYAATITYIDGTTATITAVVFQDTAGNTYLAPEFSANADQTALEAAAIRSLSFYGLVGNDYTGTTASRQTFNFVTCFTRSTLIKTDQGEVAIEELAAGDMVLTMDHGYQPIRWIGSSKRAATGDLAPILIRKGALGNDRDLRVSPQHRMLLQGWQAEMLFGELEVLATAKSLLNDQTILRDEGGEVEYFHMLFDSHEIIWAEGARSESFHPGKQGWTALDQATRDEILTLFPQLADGNFNDYGPAARMSLKHKEGKLLGAYMAGSV